MLRRAQDQSKDSRSCMGLETMLRANMKSPVKHSLVRVTLSGDAR